MFKLTAQVFLSLVLFVGGIVLLALRIPGWSLFLGLPAVQIGIIFIIFTFDKLSRDTLNNYLNNRREITCSVCGKKTSTPIFIDGALCPLCQRRKKPKEKV